MKRMPLCLSAPRFFWTMTYGERSPNGSNWRQSWLTGSRLIRLTKRDVAARISKNRAITVEAESEHFGREMSAELEVAVSLAEEPDGHMGNGGNQPNGLDQ